MEIKNSLNTLNSKAGGQGKSCLCMLVLKGLYPYQNQMSHLYMFDKVGDGSEKHREHMEWVMCWSCQSILLYSMFNPCYFTSLTESGSLTAQC